MTFTLITSSLHRAAIEPRTSETAKVNVQSITKHGKAGSACLRKSPVPKEIIDVSRRKRESSHTVIRAKWRLLTTKDGTERAQEIQFH